MNSRKKDLSSPWWSRWVPWSPSSRSWRKRCCRATRAGSPGEGSSPGCPCSPRWNPPACGPTCSLWVGCSRMESCRNDYPCWRNSGCDRTVDLVNGESLSLSLCLEVVPPNTTRSGRLLRARKKGGGWEKTHGQGPLIHSGSVIMWPGLKETEIETERRKRTKLYTREAHSPPLDGP